MNLSDLKLRYFGNLSGEWIWVIWSLDILATYRENESEYFGNLSGEWIWVIWSLDIMATYLENESEWSEA